MESGRRDYCENRRHQTRERIKATNKTNIIIIAYYDNSVIKPNNTQTPIKQTVGFASGLQT